MLANCDAFDDGTPYPTVLKTIVVHQPVTGPAGCDCTSDLSSWSDSQRPLAIRGDLQGWGCHLRECLQCENM
ncbi:hypothetical protein WG66_014986, partial [Moniliophthora roreri]